MPTTGCRSVQANLPRGRTGLASLWSISIAVLLIALSVVGGRAAQPAGMPHLDEISSTNSVFVDDVNFGKDPFFPKSVRRVPVIVTPVVKAVPESELYGQVLGSVVLKGISGVRGKRLAMLNNRTVGQGEETNISFNNQSYKVRCLEIRDKSVILGVDGSKETKEIHLRSGF